MAEDLKTSQESEKIIKLLAVEILARQKLSHLLWRQFFSGIAYGLGASIGAAAVLAILAYIYRNFLSIFLNRF